MSGYVQVGCKPSACSREGRLRGFLGNARRWRRSAVPRRVAVGSEADTWNGLGVGTPDSGLGVSEGA